jgi:hypothetical protein
MVFPGPVQTPMLAAAPGRPIAPATRVGRYLERGWFMDPSIRVAKALAGFRQGRASVEAGRRAGVAWELQMRP